MPSSLLRVRYATSSCSASHSTSRNFSSPANSEADASALTRVKLIAALEIDPSLCNGDYTDEGLICAYAKWKAIKAAYQKLQTMAWNGTKPTYGVIIALFVSTSMFYSHYKYFKDAVKYPEMVEWLEERQNGPSDMDIWGYEKSYYTFSDFMKWLKEACDGVSVDSDSKSDGWKKKGKKAMVVKKKSSEKDGKRLHKSKAKSSGSKKL
jgi:hypothetical protein